MGAGAMTTTPVPMLYPHSYPRRLGPAENAAITAQCLTTAYPDDMTPVPLIKKEDRHA